MLIVDDKVLAAAGIDYATARALLAPAEDELVVHVQRFLGPTQAHVASVENGVSLPVIAPAPAERVNTVEPERQDLIELCGAPGLSRAPGFTEGAAADSQSVAPTVRDSLGLTNAARAA